MVRLTKKATRVFKTKKNSLNYPRKMFMMQKGCLSYVQVSLVICGRYIPSFWTANLEFEDKKSIFDWKIVILGHFLNVNKQICR